MAKIQKKGQGLSINTIIIAAIALIVLVVVVAIFTGRLGIFSSQLTAKQGGLTCGEQGGSWTESKCTEGYVELFGAKDASDHRLGVCCKREA